jgi:hypothetical protein
MPLPTSPTPRPPRRRESQLEEGLERRHAGLCAHVLAAHAEACRLMAMQQYVRTLAD